MAKSPAAIAFLLWAIISIPTASDDEVIDFATEVAPILERHCFECHGPTQHYSNLRLDLRERLLRGGELGEVLVPGRPEESPLYLRIVLPQDDLDFMPVDNEPLRDDETETVRRWIAAGADFNAWTGVE